MRLVVIKIGAVDKVRDEVGRKDESLNSRWECANIHGSGKHNFLVVTLLVERGVNKVLLEPWPYSRLIRLPESEVCGGRVETQEMAEMSVQYLTEAHDQYKQA